MAKKNGSLELAARNGLIKRNRMACHLFQNAGADTRCADLSRFMALEMLLQKKSPGGSRGPDRCQQQTDKDRNMEAQSHKYPSSNKKDTPIYIYIYRERERRQIKGYEEEPMYIFKYVYIVRVHMYV